MSARGVLEGSITMTYEVINATTGESAGKRGTWESAVEMARQLNWAGNTRAWFAVSA
jgi:hypothetical protein